MKKRVLDVIICTYGNAGLRNIERMNHPRVEGVRYVVACQIPDTQPEIPDALKRDDFMIVVSESRGLSHNRNIGVMASDAPLMLIADDDIRYTPEGLSSVIKSFQKNPDYSFLTFRFSGDANTKRYPAEEADISSGLPKNYYITSFELALRRDKLPADIYFNEHFGIGAHFPHGEENLFVNELQERGLKGRFIPVTICSHEGTTTGNRLLDNPKLIEAQGAVVSRLYPASWLLRMLLFATRARIRKGAGVASTIKSWLKGVRNAKSMQVYSRPLLAPLDFTEINLRK